MEYETEDRKQRRKKYGSFPSAKLTSTESSDIDIDNAFQLVGGCGRFHILLHILIIYLVLTCGYHFVLAFFIGNDPPWKCVASNSSSFCMKYYGHNISSDSEYFYRRCKLGRDEWTYTTSKSYSFVTEFDLVCEYTPVAALTSAVFYIGGLGGSLVSGILADIFGRKLVLIFSLLITICFSIGCAFASSVLQLSILRGILGAVHVACFFTAFVFLSEFTSPNYRAISANIFVMSLTGSFMLIDLFAYFERNWRHLQFYASFPCILALIVSVFAPESPRWLLATKHDASAKNVLENIAVFNGHTAMDIRLKPLTYEKKYSYIDLLGSWTIARLILALGVLWTTIPLVYYSIALESFSLGGNMYQAFALLALADFPSYFLSFYTCNRYGRKRSNLICLTISGFLVGIISLVPQSFPHKYEVMITIVVLAKFFTVMSFNGMYTWTFELFPTVLRSQGMSVCVIFERLGLIAVPFLTTVLQSWNYHSPFVFMCFLAIFASIIGLILPETNNKPTREKYEDFFVTSLPYDNIDTGSTGISENENL